MHMLAYDGHNSPLTPPGIVGLRGGSSLSALCMASGMPGDAGRPDPTAYPGGSGLSPNPNAAAFRSSDFSRFAFTFASYSSIDRTT